MTWVGPGPAGRKSQGEVVDNFNQGVGSFVFCREETQATIWGGCW